MMKNVDFIIVGGGYAGLFFAHQCIKNNKTFILVDDRNQKSASEISAGIINPVVLKKFTTFWKAQEQIDQLKLTLLEIEQYTHSNYLINQPIHRIFHDENEKNLWKKKSDVDDLRNFLSVDFSKLDKVNNDYGTGKVNNSYRLDVSNFFAEMYHYLEQNGHLINATFQYDHLIPNESIYKNIIFKKLIFCEGIGVLNNPYFNDLPIHPNKGHQITLNLTEKLNFKYSIKKKHFLFPKVNNNYYYGGTYDRNTSTPTIDQEAIVQLENGLKEIYSYDYKVIEKNTAFRPTVKDRRPFLDAHEKYKNLYVFNGLGARGILNANYFSIILFNHLENNVPLPTEVLINRF